MVASEKRKAEIMEMLNRMNEAADTPPAGRATNRGDYGIMTFRESMDSMGYGNGYN